ncbi:MAG: hypothetical protein IPL67_20055 [Ignavibacteria bacterium]|nr:hypothetical protein [Ignavibacteria bacterium]
MSFKLFFYSGNDKSDQRLKLSELFPLLLAVSGIMDDRDSRIDAIIKEKCTAIHSSLEWRFREAAAVVLSGKKRR